MPLGQSRAWSILIVIAIFFGAALLGIADDQDFVEAKQQVVGASEWISCKIQQGKPIHTPIPDDNYYHFECK